MSRWGDFGWWVRRLALGTALALVVMFGGLLPDRWFHPPI